MAQLGCAVTVFEQRPEIGGVLEYGIPEFRLPRACLLYTSEQVLAGGDGWDPEGGDGDAVETAGLSANGRTVHIETYRCV